MKYIIATLFSILFIACKNDNWENVDFSNYQGLVTHYQQIDNTKWNLEEVIVNKKSYIFLNPKTYFNFGNDGYVRGFLIVNSFFGPYSIDNQKLAFPASFVTGVGELFSTEVKQENAILNTFGEMQKIYRNKNILYLSNPQETKTMILREIITP